MTMGAFTVGGAVQAGGGVYIERKADRDLIELCGSGTFAYVLAPRQMGKSSLMVHTVRRLRQRGVACVTIILTAKDVTPDQWYRALLIKIADQLHLPTDPQLWWNQHDDLSFSQRFKQFLQEVLPAETTQPVVIFIDEIELTLGLTFADDFFGVLRSLYDERATSPALGRISFVLIGAAAPSELVKQPTRAPFNVGRAVTMTDFTFDEAQQLAQGFSAPLEDSKRALSYILNWTGGHPYLTQCLCSALLDHNESWDQDGIARLVQQTLFGSSEAYNSNLQEVQRTITKRSEDPYASLTTYRAILRSGHVADSAQSSAKEALKLSGIVETRDDQLEVRNQIYRVAFDQDWVQEQLELLPNYLPRRILHTLQYTAYILLVPLILLAAIAGYQWYRANNESQAAKQAAATAEVASGQAQMARMTADAAAELEKAAAQRERDQRKLAQAAALALHALARRGDGDFSLRTLLSAADLGWTPAVDQAMRQVMPPQPCVQLNRRVYDAVWPTGRAPNVLVAAVAGAPTPTASDLLIRTIERPASSGAWLSLDGSRAVVASGEDTAQVLDTSTNQVRAELRGTGGALRRAIWSPDGQRILTIAKPGTARVWDATSGKQLRALLDGTPITSAAWSSDSQRIVTGSAEGRIRIWVANAEQMPTVLGVPLGPMDNVAWRSDGAQIAVATQGVVQVWDARDGKPLFALDTQSSRVQAVGWSPQLRYVLTVGDDSKIRIWDATSGARLSILETKLPIAATAWSTEDYQILVASEDGSICIYDTPEGMRATARAAGIEPLPPQQVEQLLQELLPTPLLPTGTPTLTPTTILAATPDPEPATLSPTAPDRDVVEPPTRTFVPATATSEPSAATPESATATSEPTTATPEPATLTPIRPRQDSETATATPKPPTATPEPATVTPDVTTNPSTPVEPTPDPTTDSGTPTIDPSAPTAEPTTGEPEPTTELTTEPEPSAEPTTEPEPSAEPTTEPEPTASASDDNRTA